MEAPFGHRGQDWQEDLRRAEEQVGALATRCRAARRRARRLKSQRNALALALAGCLVLLCASLLAR